VQIADDVLIGGHVVIHSNVSLAAGCAVLAGAVLGARLGREARDVRPTRALLVGPASTIGTHAVVFEGTEIGARVTVGDQTYVREDVRLGDDCLLGQRASLAPDTVVGARVRIQYQSSIAPPGVVEDDVFIGPNVTTTNDNTVHRMGPDDQLRGPVLRRGCRIGAGALLLPGVEVGEQAFVAAGSLVTRDVPPRVVVMGQPARVVREVAERDLLAMEAATPGAAGL
jgi:acetyltransferase-like isoleucine patch superfamily enzyme